MIDLINNQDLTLAERRNILQRAIYSQPFWNLLDFEFLAGAEKTSLYQGKARVDKDFWITEVKGNFGEVFTLVNSLYVLSLYTAQESGSLYRHIRALPLPTAFQCYECRFNTAFATQIFDDRQREIMPRLIKRGDSILGQLTNVSPKLEQADAKIVLAGYYAMEESRLSQRALQGINESLDREIKYEYWTFDVDFIGQKIRMLQNDRYARLVLGFGIRDKETDKGLLSQGTMQITDTFRSLRFNNEPLPIEYFAPRLTCLRDTHIYYLPIEYLLEPFAPLKFEIVNELNAGTGYEFVMLTRTV